MLLLPRRDHSDCRHTERELWSYVLPTTVLTAVIQKGSETIEKFVAASGNLKGTFKLFLEGAARNTRVCDTELTKALH